MFGLKTRYSEYNDCVLQKAKYTNNGHIAVCILSKSEGPVANITVNLHDTNQFPRNFAFVDTNNFPGAEDLIHRLRIGRNAGMHAQSGFCTYPLYEFDVRAIDAYTK